jgi:hypothetical protein
MNGCDRRWTADRQSHASAKKKMGTVWGDSGGAGHRSLQALVAWLSWRNMAPFITLKNSQAALSLTALRFRRLFWAYEQISQKPFCFLAQMIWMQHEHSPLSGLACMKLACLLKGGCVIALVVLPHGKDDPDPDVGQCSYCHRMAFAFISLPLVIVGSPRLAEGSLPGKLLKRIAQRFDTTQSAMRAFRTSRFETALARFPPKLADCLHPGSALSHPRFRPTGVGPDAGLHEANS